MIPGACSIKLFTDVILDFVLWLARMFVIVRPFHLSVIFAGKARSQPLEQSSITGSTRVGSNLVYKYLVGVEVTDSDKHSKLWIYLINYSCKKYYSACP